MSIFINSYQSRKFSFPQLNREEDFHLT